MDIARGSGRDVVLQAFHWNLVKTQGTGTVDGQERSWYATLSDHTERIAALGFSVVYLPPPWRDDSEWTRDGKHGGGEGYFWHDFDLDSRYGTKAELTSLVAALKAHGVRCIVDVVPNHRDHRRMQADLWPHPGPAWARGGGDTGAGFEEGCFDLNLKDRLVFERITRALNELTDECGIDGWRWDFVWGFAIEDVVDFVRTTPHQEYLSIGEYFQGDGHKADDPLVARFGADERERILGWAREAGSCAFDVILKRAIQTTDPAQLASGLCCHPDPEARAMMVTFVDNHDTGASPFSPANGWGQQHWPCPDHFKSKAYAFILTMPGIPSVYWPDCFDWGFEARISQLIAARHAAGIGAASHVEDLSPLHGGFAAIVHDLAGKPSLAVSIGSSWSAPEDDDAWSLAAEDPGEWSVWTRAR